MPFTTLSYIAFFAILFFVYYAIPRRFQWGLLLIGSLIFYGWMSPSYLFFLFATIAITYAGAVGMDHNLQMQKTCIKAQGKVLDRDAKKAYKARMEHRRNWMLCGVIFGLMVMLGTFKYGQFLVDNTMALLGWVGVIADTHSVALDLILPIGLSFYIFQSLGYCIDVSREEVPAERNFLKHALYVSFFPQVMQGPIGNYAKLQPQLFAEHEFDYDQVKFGLQRVAWGLFKKLVIANAIAHKIDAVWTSVDSYSGLGCWLVILIAYAIQLYADFSGYMDIACGCSRVLGVELEENFNCPYLANSVADFWRRWHMTLGEWFKNYLFYPFLRSDWCTSLRKKAPSNYLSVVMPTTCALLIVWLMIGLWHGANWAYVMYGLYYGVFMLAAIITEGFVKKMHKSCPAIFESWGYKVFEIVRTFLIVVIGYAIFKPADLPSSAKIYSSMQSLGNQGLATCRLFVFDAVPMWSAIALLFFVDLVHFNKPNGTIRGWIAKMPWLIRVGIYVVGLFYIINFGMYGDGFNHFEYFKF